LHVQDGGHLLIFDLDKVARLLGDVLIVRRDCSHPLAGVADPITGEGRHVAQTTAIKVTCGVGTRDNGVDARKLESRFSIDTYDSRVGMGTL
jgi:hypothetical protein